MTSNNLSKEEQIEKGRGAQQKGDWCELIAAAHFRKEGYLVFTRMSGPIDLVLVHQDTGETRYVDVKYKNTRQGTKSKGKRINRSVTSPLKNLIKIEIIYVGDDSQIEKAYANGRQRWHREYKMERNALGHYNGKVVSR
jgi:Holliday junction resolvase-like predicted endonuclease